MSIEQWSDLMFPEPEGKDTHAWGRVKSINADGSYEVRLNSSSVTTRCTKGCTANAGDWVLVLIKANGKCDAIARRGGDAIGNDGQGDYLAGEGIRIENLVISADVTEDDLDAATEVIPTSWIENLD